METRRRSTHVSRDQGQSSLPKDPPLPNEKLEYMISKGSSSSQIIYSGFVLIIPLSLCPNKYTAKVPAGVGLHTTLWASLVDDGKDVVLLQCDQQQS